ncbi:trypsin-like serine protease [Erythrobacter donghaensis]|uniref:trypsin-like serine protease n=1 Tax=Erythrobacter donghaensis TaxID=267135 RepID=UPI000A384E31|nr:trypsin-like serine protease [Erythrobacter donghaensis]
MGWRNIALAGWMWAAMALAASPALAMQTGETSGELDPREERALSKACERGDRSACVTLGRRLAEPYALHRDRARALALLRPVCDAPASVNEAAEICGIVGEMLLVAQTIGAAEADPALTGPYLARACDMGSRPTCALLAGELDSGERLAPDPERARSLYQRLCRGGDEVACDILAPPAPRMLPPPAAPMVDAREPDVVHDRAVAMANDNRRLPPPATPPVGDAGYDGWQGNQSALTDDESETQYRPQRAIVRINRGGAVPAGTANWVAMLWRPKSVALEGRMLCGGSLIATGWVLTAAHCLEDSIGRVRVGSGHTVRLGVQNPLDESEGNTHVITGVYAHPAFLGTARSKALAWDIALIKIAPKPTSRGTLRGRIAPVTLDTMPVEQREIAPNTPATVLGWGRTSLRTRNIASSLMKGQVSLQDRKTCTEETRFTDIRRDSVLCASERRGQHNCDGDSGGPTVLDGGSLRTPLLIGVISSANKCGEGDTPSRFVRVTHPAVREWLALHLPPEVWRAINRAGR